MKEQKKKLRIYCHYHGRDLPTFCRYEKSAPPPNANREFPLLGNTTISQGASQTNNVVAAAQLPLVVRWKAAGEEGRFRSVNSLERVMELGVLGEGKELQWRFHGGATEHEWCDKVDGGHEVARCFSSVVGVSCITRPLVARMKGVVRWWPVKENDGGLSAVWFDWLWIDELGKKDDYRYSVEEARTCSILENFTTHSSILKFQKLSVKGL
ncbi:amidohydrolase [Sesbania bispinosa]|nr:amidohydrolase [Sesbania bispinosa]